mgnify:CR=1 FL=1
MTYGDHITTYKAKILHNAQEAKKISPLIKEEIRLNDKYK